MKRYLRESYHLDVMGEAEDEDLSQRHRFNHHALPPDTPRPMAGPEEYHLFLWHNKHLLFELKMSVIVVLGGIIVLACVVYIVIQCRARAKATAHAQSPRKEDEKELFGSTETLDNLLPAENCIRLKVRKEQEFYV